MSRTSKLHILINKALALDLAIVNSSILVYLREKSFHERCELLIVLEKIVKSKEEKECARLKNLISAIQSQPSVLRCFLMLCLGSNPELSFKNKRRSQMVLMHFNGRMSLQRAKISLKFLENRI